LRKLILGVYEGFPSNTSWRFLDRNYAFNELLNPLEQDYNEEYHIPQLENDMTVDFIAIKTGDVNNSVELAFNGNISNRGTNALLTYDDLVVTKGQVVSIPFNLESEQELNGFQVNLDYNSDQLIILEVLRKDGSLNQANYKISDTNLKISYDGDSKQELFEVLAIMKINGDLSNAFKVNEKEMKSELYTSEGNLLSPTVIGATAYTEGDFLVLEQNLPNPFNTQTAINFYLPESGQVELSITDVEGKLIKTNTKNFEFGHNSLMVTKDELNGSGVYYLTLSAKNNRQTIKMILVD